MGAEASRARGPSREQRFCPDGQESSHSLSDMWTRFWNMTSLQGREREKKLSPEGSAWSEKPEWMSSYFNAWNVGEGRVWWEAAGAGRDAKAKESGLKVPRKKHREQGGPDPVCPRVPFCNDVSFSLRVSTVPPRPQAPGRGASAGIRNKHLAFRAGHRRPHESTSTQSLQVPCNAGRGGVELDQTACRHLTSGKRWGHGVKAPGSAR